MTLKGKNNIKCSISTDYQGINMDFVAKQRNTPHDI